MVWRSFYRTYRLTTRDVTATKNNFTQYILHSEHEVAIFFKVGVKEWEGSLSYLLLLFHYVSIFLLSRHTIEKISLFCNLMTYSNVN